MEKEDRNALIEYVSAINHVDENDPPFYLEHGLVDGTVSYTQSCDLYNALVMAGNEKSELHLYPGMDHVVTWFPTEKDVFADLKWVEEHADEFHLDLDNVVMTGDSAGCYLVNLSATILSEESLQKQFELDAPSYEHEKWALTPVKQRQSNSRKSA